MNVSRREFLAGSAAAGLGLLTAGRGTAAPFKTKLHKALIRGLPNEGVLKSLKDAGFEGIECGSWDAAPDKAKAARDVAEKLGMRIHSVLRGWVNFNNPKRTPGELASVETALRTAGAYGADAVLLVPCRTGGMPMPQPWEFDIAFDEKTGHVTRVAKGDNAKFQKYIAAQNQATDMTREAIKKLIPTAEKAGVVVALENVWNNLWVKPDLFAHFIASFQSPWVQAYFDIGNHVKYAPPEQWIKALGKNIAKCHVKDFKLNANGQGGRFVNIRDGSVDWTVVRKALDDVGYNGWMTIEGSGDFKLEEQNRRLDLICAGR
ncbi:sugar phosphate isomerase/epimerase [bacterium]|nr:sugar phosphate isomerase/epimerase [bacterium]